MLKGTIHSISGDIFTVTITEEDPKIKEIDLADEPCIIERSGEDDGLFSPIISTSCTLHLTSDSDYQFDYLATDDYPHVVVVAHGLDVIFVGPIEKGLHKEAYDKTPFTVEVIAGCGIKNLKNWTPHFPELTDDFRGAKEITIKELIEGCLTVAGDHIKPTFDTSKLEYWQDELDATFDAREWLYDGNIRDTTTAYDVLTDILTTMGARCYQHNGIWYIDRPGDLLQRRSHREISVDNDKVYFIDNANTSISKASGAMEITMPMKVKKNLITSRIDAVDDPNGWHIVNTGGGITRASADGYDVHISASHNGNKVQSVECHYKVPFKKILASNKKINQIRISAKFFSPNTHEADRCTAEIYMYPVITDIQGNITFVPVSGNKNYMVSFNTKAGILFGGTRIFASFEDLQKKGGTQVQQNFNFDRDEILKGDAHYLELRYTCSVNTHQEGPNYNADKFTLLEDIEIGDITLTLGSEFDEEYTENELKLFVRCKEADESLAEEVDVGFVVDGPLCDTGMMINRTLMKNGQPISLILKRGTGVGVDPLGLLARDRALQYSSKREVIDATLNTSTLYAPFEVIRVGMQAKTYLATSQRADLMNDTNEITLTELVNDTVKIISRD